jgi:ubiquinone/menaquinone biosynthesis C-methylase UbiE
VLARRRFWRENSTWWPHGAPRGVWADFGSGRGAFTLALADHLGPAGIIYSVDRDSNELAQQERLLSSRFPQVTVHYLAADFTHPLILPPLDGIIMANALHFSRQKEQLVRRVKSCLRPGGRFLLIEYNTDRGNPWVPHPLSFATWQKLAPEIGFQNTELLQTVPSSFLGEFYSAVSW